MNIPLILSPAGRVGESIVYDHLDQDGRKLGVVRVLASGTWVARHDAAPVVVQASSLAELRQKMSLMERIQPEPRPRRRSWWRWYLTALRHECPGTT